jgi:repressor LexA
MSPLQYKIYNFIKDYLVEYGYSPSLSDIARGIGISHRSKSLISRYVHVLVKDGWLLLDKKKYRKIRLAFSSQYHLPVIGKIVAGTPIKIISQQTFLDLASILYKEGYFILEVEGNFMQEEGILSGDKIICMPQTNYNENDIVVVLIDQEKVALRRIHHQENNQITLESIAPYVEQTTFLLNRIIIKGIFIGLLRLPYKV